MSKLNSLRKKIVRSKIFLQRSMSWLVVANAAMIFFLVLSKFQDYGYYIYITKWIIPLFFGFMAFMLIFGYLEDKLGFYAEEINAYESKNPYMEDIVKRLERIEQQLKIKTKRK